MKCIDATWKKSKTKRGMMAQESSHQCIPSSEEDEEPTVPRIAVLSRTTKPITHLLEARQQGPFRLSIDELGFVKVAVPGQETLVLRPEEAFELLDLLFAHRNLLASRSAESAEL